MPTIGPDKKEMLNVNLWLFVLSFSVNRKLWVIGLDKQKLSA